MTPIETVPQSVNCMVVWILQCEAVVWRSALKSARAYDLPLVMPSLAADSSRLTVLLCEVCMPPRSMASLPLMKTHRSSSPMNVKVSPP